MGAHKFNPFAHGTNNRQPSVLKDATGRDLAEHDEVIATDLELRAPKLIVGAIRPNLHPQAPPNTVIVTAVLQVQFVFPANRPVPNLYRIRTAEEVRVALGEAPDGHGDTGADSTAGRRVTES